MFSKKLLTLYIILLTVTIILMGGLIYIREKTIVSRDYPEIRKEGVLRIVTESDPSGYFENGNQIEGFQYELSKAIARLSGLEILMYLDINLDKSFEGLQNNYYDIIARNIPTTSQLKETYLFTDPVILSKHVLIQRKKAHNHGIEPIRNQLDLADKTLHVPASSPALLRLQHLQREIGDTVFIVEEPLYSPEQLILMVVQGDIDYAVCDMQIALVMEKQYPEIDIKTDISFTQLQAWAIRKTSPALLDSLNHWLHLLRETGEFDTIYRQYYHDISSINK
jgi:membrane-bound lytic murein transglycosylase MltF